VFANVGVSLAAGIAASAEMAGIRMAGLRWFFKVHSVAQSFVFIGKLSRDL
jgi:hypothetical protein